jgi:hypothetical protein
MTEEHEADGGENRKRDLDPGWPDFSFNTLVPLVWAFSQATGMGRAAHKVARSSRKAGPADSRRSEGGMAFCLVFPMAQKDKIRYIRARPEGCVSVHPCPLASESRASPSTNPSLRLVACTKLARTARQSDQVL